MPDLSPKDLEIVKNHYYTMSKGRMARFVARGKENPSTISRAVKTLMRNGRLSGQDLDKILHEVEKESVEVEAFIRDGTHDNRKERFEKLKEELRLRD